MAELHFYLEHQRLVLRSYLVSTLTTPSVVSWEPWESHPLSSLAKHQSVPWRQIDVIEVLFMGGMVRMEELREI